MIVEETLAAGSSVARVALKHGVNANQVFKWRRLYEAGRLGSAPVRGVQLLPVQVSEQSTAAIESVATPVSSSGTIHIELPGRATISVESGADSSLVRSILESLRK